MRWTNEEFDRVAMTTRLAEKTVAACRDVLVKGISGAAAGETHGVLPPHVSRGIKVLTERRDQLRAVDRENTEALRTREVSEGVAILMNAAAREAAQSIKGSGWIIREPIAGHVYEGAGVVKVGGFFVQDVGRVGVIHDLRNLTHDPELGKRLEIIYPKKGRGTIIEISVDRGERLKER